MKLNTLNNFVKRISSNITKNCPPDNPIDLEMHISSVLLDIKKEIHKNSKNLFEFSETEVPMYGEQMKKRDIDTVLRECDKTLGKLEKIFTKNPEESCTSIKKYASVILLKNANNLIEPYTENFDGWSTPDKFSKFANKII